jgi:hypothetical protein
MTNSVEGFYAVGRSDRRDAVLWFVLGVLVLTVLPIGWVSGDGLVQSARYAKGDWTWDPNSLLLEPLGGWWQTTLTRMGAPRSGVDLLKLLSVLSGGVTLGLYRWGFAARLTPSRLAANHAVAWVALGSAFSRMWVSEEAYMLQMPFLVLAAIGITWFLERPMWAHSIVIGVFTAVAALFFISNLLLAASIGTVLGIWYAGRREWAFAARAFVGIGIGAAAAAGSVLWFGWANYRTTNTGFLTWVASYGGGEQGFRRFAEMQGLSDVTLASLLISSARTLYGASSAVVDLAPVVEVFRDDLQPTLLTALNVVAFIAGVSLFVVAALRLFRQAGALPHHAVRLITIAWIVQIFLFMVAWDNSDAQFYFHLAIPLGGIVAVLPLLGTRRLSFALAGLSTFALLWNARDLLSNYILYPRSEYVAALRQGTAGSGLIIYPGRDDVDHLLSFVERRADQGRLPLTELANKFAPEEGFRILEDTISATLRRGDRVDVVSVYEAPPRRHPWKSLRGIGYEHGHVITTFDQFGVESRSRRLGPWTVRSIGAQTDGSTGVTGSAPVR